VATGEGGRGFARPPMHRRPCLHRYPHQGRWPRHHVSPGPVVGRRGA